MDDLPGLIVYGNAEDPFAADDNANDIIRVDEIGVADATPVTDNRAGAQLYGQGGNDDIEGSRRDDVINGGLGGDILEGHSGSDILQGGAGDDLLYGGAGADVLYGGSDNDVLYGDIRGAATIAPDQATWPGPQNGIQNDAYFTISHRAYLTPLISGAYTLMPEAGGAEAGADLLFGGGGEDYLIGGGGNDLLNGDGGNDLLEGEGGDDSLAGGDGNDWIYGDISSVSYAAYHGIFDSGTLAGGGVWSYRLRDYPDGPDAFGNDQLSGGAGADRLFGGAGNDHLDGGSGNDILSGDSGSDSYYFSRGWGTDIIDELSGVNDAIELGDGIGIDDIHLRAVGDDLHIALDDLFGNPGKDRLVLRNWFIGDAIERIRFADGNDWDTGTIEQLTGQQRRPGTPGDPVDAIALGGSGNDSLLGGPLADALYGLGGDDSLAGGAGDDSLLGGAGDDVLSGGAGNDVLSGGPGRDRLDGDAGSDTYRFAPGDGEDTINDTAGAHDRILLDAPITPQDLVIGHGGDDLLLTRMQGGLPSTDSLRVTGGFGTGDTIETVQFADGTLWDRAALTAGISHYELHDGDTINGTAGDNLYTLDPGLAAGFTLTVADAGGQDTLWLPDHDRFIPSLHTYNTRHTEIIGSPHRDGNDIILDLSLWGDGPTVTGSLRLVGQYNDNNTIDYVYSAKVTYATRAAAIAHPGRYTNSWSDGWDWQQWRAGPAAFNAVLLSGGPGDDTLKADAPVDTQLYGNAGNDTLSGNSRNDILAGGPGSDILQGGAGNDVYMIEADGTDRIQDDARGQAGFTGDTLRLPSGTALAGLDLRRQGNDLWLGNNRIENQFLFSPDPHHDETPFAIEYLDDGDWRTRHFSVDLPGYLQGLGLSAQVTGDAGDNALAGDGVSNHIDGLGGNDTLYGLEGDDRLAGGAGNDILYGGGSQYRWWAPDGNDTLLGGAGDDTLYGGSGDDILSGGTGTDRIEAGAGDDIIHIGEDGSWRFGFALNVGSPDHGSWPDYRQHRRWLNLRGYHRNTDVIDGGLGQDLIQGTEGNDALVLDDGLSPWPAGAWGPRLAGVEQIFMGAGDDIVDLTSRRYAYGDVRIDGGDGNDRLWASSGNDTLTGGAGDDELYGGTGADRYRFNIGDGHDTLIDPISDSGDSLRFGPGISKEDLWFEKALDNLRIHVLDGRDDSVEVANWRDGQAKPINTIELSDGQVLLETQVARIIQAMAAFDAPGAFETGLHPQVQQQLAPVLAEVWQGPAGQV